MYVELHVVWKKGVDSKRCSSTAEIGHLLLLYAAPTVLKVPSKFRSIAVANFPLSMNHLHENSRRKCESAIIRPIFSTFSLFLCWYIWREEHAVTVWRLFSPYGYNGNFFESRWPINYAYFRDVLDMSLAISHLLFWVLVILHVMQHYNFRQI